jgi:four helix bundle protein
MPLKMPKPHHQFNAWKRAAALVKRVYDLTTPYPAEESLGLTALMRRAAVAIPSNIAEGVAMSRSGQCTDLLHSALGSVAQLETQVILSQRLGLLDVATCVEMLQEIDAIAKMITGLQDALQ